MKRCSRKFGEEKTSSGYDVILLRMGERDVLHVIPPSSSCALKPILDPIGFTISQVCGLTSILMAPSLGPAPLFCL